MFPFEHKYTVTVSDVRRASYFALVQRKRKSFIAMAAVIVFALIYFGSSLAAGKPGLQIIYYIAGAYAVWGILQFAGAEKLVRNNVKNPASPIGKPTTAIFTKEDISIRIPACSVDVTMTDKHLAVIFELQADYLVYTNANQVYIVPKKGLSEERRQALRGLFRARLGDRFWTRFEKKK
ncbi:MAG: hypothetical protein MJ078_05260 [Clostridia bacterium]|nr:hypothetical protein [Clostridia bacterium]